MELKELKEKALEIVELYNKHDSLDGKKITTTEGIVMQFVSDVGDLSRYIVKKERGDQSEDFNENVARELAECLGHILVLSEKYGVDVEEAFVKEFDRLKSQLL